MDDARPSPAPSPPSRPLARALGAGISTALVALGLLAALPQIFALAWYLAGPLAAGLLFASPNGNRETIAANGYTAAVFGGLAWGAWVASNAEIGAFSRVVSFFVTFFLSLFVAGALVYFVSRRFRSGDELAAPAPPLVRTLDD